MSNLLESAGARDEKTTRFVPIFTNRFFLGLWTNRNTLRAPTGVIYENYYKLGGTDALLAGTNIEVSNRLTLIRRPGNTAGLTTFISGSNVPGVIDSFFSFHEIGGNIRVLADTNTNTPSVYLIGGQVSGSGTGSQGVIPIFTKGSGAGQTFYQGVGQSLFMGDGVEQVKWLDFGAGNPGNSFSTITNTALTSNVATITSVNNLAVGQTVVVSGTTNGSGALNGTFTVTAANAAQFQFNLTNANIGSAADTGFANGCWNWSIAPPAAAPTLTITASGSAATIWQQNTVFSTMGLIYDSVSSSVQQLISVNALANNSTQFGTSGNGEPVWNQTPGGTTSDTTGGGTITWTNWGPIPAWAATKLYNNGTLGGSNLNPCVVYDPVTKTMPLEGNPGNNQGTSGVIKPAFVAQAGVIVWDPAYFVIAPTPVKWFMVFPAPSRWKASTSYPAFLPNVNGALTQQGLTSIVEPVALPAPNNQTVFLQISGGGTSGTGYAPAFSATASNQVSDNQLTWQSCGSGVWAASTVYTKWTRFPSTFSAIKDSNGNLQVCAGTTGNAQSGATQPLAAWVAGKVYVNGNTISDSNGRLQTVTTGGTSGVSKTLTTSVLLNGVATYTTSAVHGYAAGQYVTVTASTHNAVFNVSNAIITAVPTTTTFTIALRYDDIGSAADTGNSKAGPTWAAAGTTTDGTVTWTAGALQNGWGVNYQDTTQDGNVQWVCVGPPLTWAGSTIYHLPGTGFAPPSSAQAFGGSQVISGTSPTQFVQAVMVSGKSGVNPGPTFSVKNGNFVNDNTIVWQDIAAYSQTQNSLAFKTSYLYSFAYKARSAFDQYSPTSVGGLGLIAPGFFSGSPNGSAALGVPTGSADASVSTASPTVGTTGTNTGAVITVSGVGSTDPQVDTIVIFRSADGGATMFELTEIPNPPTVQGQAQNWSFQDFLPDTASGIFPGLNTLVLAPTAHSNDPIRTGAVNLVQYFGRIFYSVGATVFCTQGPNIGGGSQPPGNGYTSSNPAQFFTFPAPVTRLVPTSIGLLVFTASDLGIIAGGPNIATMFPNIHVPGLGLTSYNALSVQGGLIFMFTADNQVVSLDPNMGISKIGYAIGDQLSKFNGKTSTFSPSSSYVTFHIQGLMDEALFVADGSTGWFRCNINQAPDSAITGPVWSPKATIAGGGGCGAIQSLEVALGQHALLIGATTANKPVLVRDSTFSTFADNSVAYASNCILGNIILASPGQMAELGFCTCEFAKTGTSPKLLALLNETQDTLVNISAATQSGGNTTYTYTLVSGPDLSNTNLVILTITGMADAANNGTFQLNAVSAGTFTVTNSGVTRGSQSGVGTRFEDLSGYISSATSLPPQDPPLIYGLTGQPTATYSNRYYFAQSVGGQVPPMGTSCRYLQLKLDYGSTDTVMNELFTQTIWGAHWQEA